MVEKPMCYISGTFIGPDGYAKFAELVSANFLSLKHTYKFVDFEELKNKVVEAKAGNINIDFDIEDGFLKSQPVSSAKISEEEVKMLGDFLQKSPERVISPLPNSIYSLMLNIAQADGYYIDRDMRIENKLEWNSDEDIGITSFKNVKYSESTMSVYLSCKSGQHKWSSRKVVYLDDNESLEINDFNFAVPSEKEKYFINDRGVELIDRATLFGKEFTLFKCIGSERLVACYATPFLPPLPLLVKYAYLSKCYKTIADILGNFRTNFYNMKTLGEYEAPERMSTISKPKVGIFVRTNYTKPRRDELRTVGELVIKEISPFVAKQDIHGAIKYLDEKSWDPIVKVAAKNLAVMVYNSKSRWAVLLELLNSYMDRLNLLIFRIDTFIYACRATCYVDYLYQNNYRDMPIKTSMVEISGDSPYNAIFERRVR